MDATEEAFYSAVLTALAILGVILTYFLVSIILQQRRYRALSKAKINAEITTLENERKRIASDLHDDIGPLLSAVKLQINHLQVEGDAQKELLKKSSNYIDEVIQKMREISNDLLPNILVRKGLVIAVEEFLRKIEDTGKLKIEFEGALEQRLPLELEVNIYRIIQEITHNVLKHSNATSYKIELTQNGNRIILATVENGKGFAKNAGQGKELGLGLLNLHSRTDIIGGELSLQSAEGKGTSYYIEIPFNPAEVS